MDTDRVHGGGLMGCFGANYLTGTFYPQNVSKCLNYNGKFQFTVDGRNVTQKPISIRSSWEWKLCKFCDSQENVLEWGSEIFTIEYINQVDGRKHRYITDFYMKVRKRSGEIVKYVVEVKPACQSEKLDQYGRLVMPPPPKHRTQKSIANWQERCDVIRKNNSKWTYAREWCARQGYKFIVLNEDNIGVVQ